MRPNVSAHKGASSMGERRELWCFRGYYCREEASIEVLREKGFAGFICGRGGQAFEEHAQVGIRLQAIGLGCFDQAVNRRAGFGATRRPSFLFLC